MSSDGKIQLASTNTSYYVSHDYGNTWAIKSTSVIYGAAAAMSSNGQIMAIAGNSTYNIYISTDYGNTWTAKDSARNWTGMAMSSDGKILSSCVTSGYIYTSYSTAVTFGDLKVTGSLTMTGSLNPLGVSETYTAPAISSNVLTVDLSKGTIFNVSLNANITSFTISNPVASRANSFTLFLTQDGTGGRTVTWTFTSRTLKWAGAVAPTMTSTANKGDIYSFVSNDGGTTWYGFVGGQNF
jgi:hypothetical protein